MTVIKQDTFTVSTDTGLNSHTSDIGASWFGTQGMTALAATNEAKRDVSAIGTKIGSEVQSEADYEMEVEATLGGTAGSDRVGPIARADGGASHSSNNSYYLFRLDGDSGWKVFRVDSGGPTTSGLSGQTSDNNFNSNNGIGASTPVKLKMKVEGSNPVTLTLSINVDGGGYSVVSTVTDNSVNRITAANPAGMYIRNQNVRVQSVLWQDLVTAGPPVNDTPMPDQQCTIGVAFGPLDVSSYWTNSPTGYSATGLPNGLSINSSGVISGTPTGGFQS